MFKYFSISKMLHHEYIDLDCWALFGMDNWFSNQLIANGLFYMAMFVLNEVHG